ncbi:MAG: APC family permease [Xanthomonadales bacterium]
MNTPGHASDGLRREIGKWGFGAIALNGTIGAGIFALPAIAVQQASWFSPWVFALCGALIMAIVLVFARVASFVGDTGGPVAYAASAFGPFAGFQAGWLLTLSRAAAFAANAHLMVTYAAWFIPSLAAGPMHTAMVLVLCLVLAIVNVLGVRQGMLALFVLTALKLLPLLLLIALGLGQLRPELFSRDALPPLDSLGETMLVVFYAFVGFESAAIPAGEARNPRRDIPLALVRTVLVITVFYVLLQAVAVSVAPAIGGSDAPLADVAVVLLGGVGAAVVALGAVFSISGNLTASMLSAPRMLYALGRQGSLPAWFGRVHGHFQTPANAIGFYAGFTILLALSGGFVWLAVVSTVVRLMVYVLVVATLPVLQRRSAAEETPFHLPGGYSVPLLAAIISVWLMSFAPLESWIGAGGFMALGALIYGLARRRSARFRS